MGMNYVSELVFSYYMHPYTFMGVLLILFLYGVIHEYRSSSIIKNSKLKLSFTHRLYLFRIPSKKNINGINRTVWADVQKIAKEYFVVHILITSYFIFGILLAFLPLLSR